MIKPAPAPVTEVFEPSPISLRILVSCNDIEDSMVILVGTDKLPGVMVTDEPESTLPTGETKV